MRADGECVTVGDNGYFGERATVHIADGLLAATIGHDVTVGPFGVVHACTLGDGVVVADAATVMDAATVGPYALIAPGAVVPPRKQLAGGPGSGGRIFYRRLGHTLCLFAIDFDKIRAGGQRLR